MWMFSARFLRRNPAEYLCTGLSRRLSESSLTSRLLIKTIELLFSNWDSLFSKMRSAFSFLWYLNRKRVERMFLILRAIHKARSWNSFLSRKRERLFPTLLLNHLSSMAFCHPLSTPRKPCKKTYKKTLWLYYKMFSASFRICFLKGSSLVFIPNGRLAYKDLSGSLLTSKDLDD